jgi:ABC-2 type transport system ATP-binding protein|tara:strand:- start:2559 stop:3464 length:906 start_codon:yes stop_codon:yes gene_type:complete
LETAIEFRRLTKYYGAQRGVVDLDLDVRSGEVFGFLGPNGAGKTTTIRVLLDLIRPTRGSATLLGLDAQADSQEVRRRVGYVPGDPSLYLNLTGQELLTYLANVRGGVDWSNVLVLADRLECDLSRRIGALSRGNRQKLVVIKAFMGEPEILVLDEPTSGLDPLMQEVFEDILREVNARGTTVSLSSHILPDVEQLCDRVGIIRAGRLVDVADIDALKTRAFRTLEIEFARPVPAQDFAGLDGVRNVTVSDNTLRCDIVGALDPLIKTAARYEVTGLTTHEASLEEIFLAYYGGEDDDDAG